MFLLVFCYMHYYFCLAHMEQYLSTIKALRIRVQLSPWQAGTGASHV